MQWRHLSLACDWAAPVRRCPAAAAAGGPSAPAHKKTHMLERRSPSREQPAQQRIGPCLYAAHAGTLKGGGVCCVHSCSGPSPTSPPRHPLWPNDAHLRQRYVDSRKRGEGVPHAVRAVPLFPYFFFLLLACCHRVALGAGSGSAPRACLCGLSRMRAARTTKKTKNQKKSTDAPGHPRE